MTLEIKNQQEIFDNTCGMLCDRIEGVVPWEKKWVSVESNDKVLDEISDMEFIAKFGSTADQRLAIKTYIEWIKRFRYGR